MIDQICLQYSYEVLPKAKTAKGVDRQTYESLFKLCHQE
jgi:hypothetical protein